MRPIPMLLPLLLSGVVWAQAPQLVQRDQTPVIRVSTEFVVLDALVKNKKSGVLAGDLQASDFQLSEDGVPQRITYFTHDQLPLSVVFLFDLTDSVRPFLKPLAEGARDILGHLKPQDEVAIMVFSSHTELLQDFTTDRSRAANAIDKAAAMKTREGTFIHESMYEAVDEAMKSTTPDSRRVLVWLTDGSSNLENESTRKVLGKHAPEHLHTRQESVDKLMRSGVVVSELIEGSALSKTLMYTAVLGGVRMGDIDHYADMTGGPVLKSGKSDTARKLAELIDELRGRYTLGYRPSVTRPPGAFCNLQLALTTGAYAARPGLNAKDIAVRTRRGYYR
ncbi:MAG: VWA domain-containing protein [Terracidiphilus sp.]|nr:VWA domain-containing protein [Terracidiphilus sp.]